jgi:hypothetical protein
MFHGKLAMPRNKLMLSSSDERALRAQALTLAVQNREPGDDGNGKTQLTRAELYLKFLKGKPGRT